MIEYQLFLRGDAIKPENHPFLKRQPATGYTSSIRRVEACCFIPLGLTEQFAQFRVTQGKPEINGYINVGGSDLGLWRVVQGFNIERTKGDYELFRVTFENSRMFLSTNRHPERKEEITPEEVKVIGPLIVFNAGRKERGMNQGITSGIPLAERVARNRARRELPVANAFIKIDDNFNIYGYIPESVENPLIQ